MNTKEKDARQRKNYEVAELVTGCLSLFLFKETTRNAYNNDRKSKQFKDNYFKVFKLRMSHMDTMNKFLCMLPPVSCTETIVHYDKDGVQKGDQLTPTRFVFLTGQQADDKNVRSICETGRMRWNIENPGRLTQKRYKTYRQAYLETIDWDTHLHYHQGS